MPIFKLNDKYVTKSNITRLYGVSNPIVGLTGGIATGKSKTSSILKEKGLHIIDADQLVKDIYKKEETINFIKQISASFIKKNEIDFKKLRKAFFSDNSVKENIEKFIYSRLEEEFLNNLPSDPSELIIYDVPLLFEKQLNLKVDQSLLIYCPPDIQAQRLILRDSIDIELASKIIKSQLPIDQKKDQSDFIIENTKDIEHLDLNIKQFLDSCIL